MWLRAGRTVLTLALAGSLAVGPGWAAGPDPAAGRPEPARAVAADAGGGRDAGLLELGPVIRIAAERNPRVATARERWEAARQRRPQVTGLPDPQVMHRSFVRQMSVQQLRWEWGVTQMIPFPRKLSLRGRIADKEAVAAWYRHMVAVRDAIAEAKTTWFELYYIDRARGITGEIMNLYDRYASLAAGGEDVTRSRLPEEFRAEAQRAQLDYDLVQLEAMRQAEEARLRAVLGLAPTEPVGSTGEVAPPFARPPEFQQLLAMALQHNQELAMAGVEVERAELGSRLARVAPLPDLALGAAYMRTGGQGLPGGDPTDDPIVVSLGITLPLWADKYRAAKREAAALERAARSERDSRELTLRADLARAHFQLTTSSRLIRLYRQTLLPQARQALTSAEELYRNGIASLFGLLETTATVHNFELAALRATADFYQNVARIERLIGTALVDAPVHARGGEGRDEGR